MKCENKMCYNIATVYHAGLGIHLCNDCSKKLRNPNNKDNMKNFTLIK